MDKELRILILEDVPADAALVERELRKGGIAFLSKRVETEEAFTRDLNEFKPDIVLADYNLPSFNGPAAISIVKQKYPDLPILLVSGTVGEDIGVEMLKIGAWDYILKSRLSRLVHSVRRALKEADDLAERKRLQEALWKSAREWRATFDAVSYPIALLDGGRNIRRCNKAMAGLLGKSFNEIIGRNCCEMLHGTTETVEGCPVMRMRETLHRESHLLSKGDLRFDVVADPVVDESGQLAGAVHIMVDITDLKLSEEVLRKSEENARQLAQENTVMAEIGRIISSTLNIDEVYESFSKEVKKIISFDRIVIDVIDVEKGTVKNVYIAGEVVQDRSAEEIYPLEGSGNAEMVRTKSTLLIQTDDFSEYKDRFPMLLSTFQAGFRSIMNVPLFSKGKIIGGLLLRSRKPHAYTDKNVGLVERIGSEIAGAIANAQLYTEHIQADKERAALQEQLRQSQKMEAIGRLAGGIAHDFNNLLTVIRGYSQLSMMELKQDDPLRENIVEIEKAAQRAGDLTRQLLAFSRRQILEMRVLDLNTVLRDLDKMLRRVIGEDIELVTLLAEDLGKVKTDPGQVQQVIMNLGVNARDAMPSGGKLTIETANVELDEEYAHAHISVTPGRYAMLSVSDTGVGMTPEVKERLFEPFFTSKEKGKGTGLGLSTVYGIVKQSGGNVWVYSEPGQGTTFKIYLPQVDEPLEELKQEGAAREKLPLGSETILVVEDEKEVRKLAVRILKSRGYEVLEGANGEEALAICREWNKPIHLMITDVVMPGMSGRELANRLMALHPEMKVAYMSGYTDDAIVHHGVLEKGMNYIQKPFTIEGLARKVREVLDK